MAVLVEIEGVKYDAGILAIMNEAVAGEKNPLISFDDAHKVFANLMTSADFMEMQKRTIEYAKTHYKWTDKALAWFDAELTKIS